MVSHLSYVIPSALTSFLPRRSRSARPPFARAASSR